MNSAKSFESLDPEDPKDEKKWVVKREKIERDFLIFVGESNKVEDHDVLELVEDPQQKFDDYMTYLEKNNIMVGEDILSKQLDQQIFSNYHYNSVIHEIKPTSKMAFIKTCQKYVDIALPLISKIRNQELNLIDYQLSLIHF